MAFGDNLRNYLAQVKTNQQQPFFNKDNTPMQWLGRVAQDYQQRGPFEAAQDLTYPILENPYIQPLAEPAVGAVRVANYKAGRPFPIVNALLGQTNVR